MRLPDLPSHGFRNQHVVYQQMSNSNSGIGLMMIPGGLVFIVAIVAALFLSI